jgi:hypothetical protein
VWTETYAVIIYPAPFDADYSPSYSAVSLLVSRFILNLRDDFIYTHGNAGRSLHLLDMASVHFPAINTHHDLGIDLEEVEVKDNDCQCDEILNARFCSQKTVA